MTFCLSPVSGRLCDRFGSRPVTIIGALFCSLGLILTSLVRRVELFFLCCRTDAVRRRSFATGLVTAGAGLGVFALAPINQKLIDSYGLSIVYRVLGFVIPVNCFLALFYDPNIKEELAQDNNQETSESPEEINGQEDTQRCQKFMDFSVWKVLVFTIVAVCCAGISIVIFTPQFHLVSWEFWRSFFKTSAVLYKLTYLYFVVAGDSLEVSSRSQGSRSTYSVFPRIFQLVSHLV